MKLKFKLSLLVIAIMVIVIAGISFLLLKQASDISTELSMHSVANLVGQRVEFWKGYESGYVRVLETLAGIMSGYEEIAVENRRDYFDDVLYGTMVSRPNIVSLYSVWKPNALDGMDSLYIGRSGSGPTGQYARSYSRVTGELVGRTSVDIDAAMAWMENNVELKDRIEPPYLGTALGSNAYLYRLMVPIVDPNTNEIVGGVGCVLSIEFIQPILERTVEENEEITIMVIYANNGFIMAHVFPERVSKMMPDVDVEFGNLADDVLYAIQNGSSFDGHIYDPNFDTDIELTLRSFKLSDSDMTWSILIGTREDYIMKEVNTMTVYTVVIALFAIAIVAVILFIVINYITKPLVTVTATLKDISEGEGDLTKIVTVKGNDEIADLSRYFNLTLEKIKKLIVIIKEQSNNLSDIGADLAANMNQTATSMNQIASNIQSIKSRVLNQNASVTETAATMEQIKLTVDKLNDHIENQSASVTESSSAIEEMLANINSVTDTLVKNGKNVNELTSASDAGRTSLNDIVNDIRAIAKDSEGLMEINNVMKSIAAQTNLLSMNAAIEAAHAGEAGKGFAVVADEIRSLAESASIQSKTISVVLKKIKGAIDKITQSTDSVLNLFEAIDTDVKLVSDTEESIRNAMEEQNEGSKQVLEAITRLNEITGQVSKGSQEMREGSKGVINESKNLEMVTQEITGSVNEMAEGAEHVNTAVTKVNEICAKNKESIGKLAKEVALFKVE